MKEAKKKGEREELEEVLCRGGGKRFCNARWTWKFVRHGVKEKEYIRRKWENCKRREGSEVS